MNPALAFLALFVVAAAVTLMAADVLQVAMVSR
jgi:hypothetical protein